MSNARKFPAVLPFVFALAAAGLPAHAQAPKPTAQLQPPVSEQDNEVSPVVVRGSRRVVDPRAVVAGRLLRIDPPPTECSFDMVDPDADQPTFENCLPWEQMTAWLKDGYDRYDAGDYAGALKIFRQASLELGEQDLGIDPGPIMGKQTTIGQLLMDPVVMRRFAHTKARMGIGYEAALMSARIYIDGPAQVRDVERGVSWLKRIANTAVARRADQTFYAETPYLYNSVRQEAAVRLGALYREGSKVPRDLKLARQWYERAAGMNYVPAYKVLGDMYAAGEGGARDMGKALRLYQTAADLDFAPAQFAIGELYYRGAPGLAADAAKAFAWYDKAAGHNDPDALYAVALAYEAGDGVAADVQRAVAYYRSAAEAGDVRAQTAYGLHLYEGEVVARDLPAARQWLEKAAAAADREAMYNLGVMLTRGEGGPPDLAKAWVLFSLAKSAGQPQAAQALALVEKRMTAAERETAAGLLGPSRQVAER